MAIVRSEGFYVNEKIPVTPAGIKPVTFRFVAQHLNHCATVVPFACSTKHNVEFLAWVPCILEDTGEDYVRDWLSGEDYARDWPPGEDYARDWLSGKDYARDWLSGEDYARDWLSGEDNVSGTGCHVKIMSQGLAVR
jgi:hypothetical protein